MKHLTLKAAMLAMILLLTGCGEAAGTGKTQGTTAEQSQPQTAEQSQLQTAVQSQPQTAEQSLPQTAVLLTEKDYSEQEKKSQSPWASCWSFGAIASSETSILKKLV